MPVPEPTRVETEFSAVWAKENPLLFTTMVFNMQTKYPVEQYTHTINFTRKGFVTIAAERK